MARGMGGQRRASFHPWRHSRGVDRSRRRLGAGPADRPRRADLFFTATAQVRFWPLTSKAMSAPMSVIGASSGLVLLNLSLVVHDPEQTCSTVRSFRNQPQQGRKALRNVLSGGVERDIVAAPRFVVPLHDLVPSN